MDRVYNEWMTNQWEEHVSSFVSHEGDGVGQVVFGGHAKVEERTMGYVTKDACPGVGDDIEHVPGTSSLPLFSSSLLSLSVFRAPFQHSSSATSLFQFEPHLGTLADGA